MFDGTATVSATVETSEQLEEMKTWSRKSFFEEKLVKNQVTQMRAPNIMSCSFCEKNGSVFKGQDDAWCVKKKRVGTESENKSKMQKTSPVEADENVFTNDEVSGQIGNIRNESCSSTTSRSKKRRLAQTRTNTEPGRKASKKRKTSQIPKPNKPDAKNTAETKSKQAPNVNEETRGSKNFTNIGNTETTITTSLCKLPNMADFIQSLDTAKHMEPNNDTNKTDNMNEADGSQHS